MPLTLRYVARTNVGLVREGNEDSGYAGPRLLALADGMGGHAAGEVASAATIEELLKIENDGDQGEPLEALAAAVKAANERIRTIVARDPDSHGMGTTLTALLWTGQSLALAHIGDSRGYLLRGGELRQITHDHTFVQSLVDEGRITRDAARVHPARSMILRALQGDSDSEPDLELIEVQGGDRILICSDGLSDVVRDETLRDAMVEHTDLTAAADTLVQLALKGGAPDNVTCLLADVIETDNLPSDDDTAEAFLVGAASGEKPPSRLDRPRRGPGAAMRSLFGSSQSSAAPAAGAGPVPGVDQEELRYAPQPPRRYRWLRRLAAVAVVAAVAWAGFGLVDGFVRGQYYVGDQAGEVAIFRGIDQEVGPLRLADVHQIAAGLPIGSLPELYRDQVTNTMPAGDLPEAEAIVARLRRAACEESAPTPSPSPTPTASPAPSPTVPPPPAPRPPVPTPGTGTPGTGTPGTGTTASPAPTPFPTAPPGYPGLDCSELS